MTRAESEAADSTEGEVLPPAIAADVKLVAPLAQQEPKCGNCRYFLSGKQVKDMSGLCRRNPPHVFVLGASADALGRPQLNTQGLFAPTPFDGWCGEFKLRNEV